MNFVIKEAQAKAQSKSKEVAAQLEAAQEKVEGLSGSEAAGQVAEGSQAKAEAPVAKEVAVEAKAKAEAPVAKAGAEEAKEVAGAEEPISQAKVEADPAKVAEPSKAAVEGGGEPLSPISQAKVEASQAKVEASDEKRTTTLEQRPQANEEENKKIIEGSLIAAVATMSAATKIAESKDVPTTVPSTVTSTVPTTVTSTVPTTVTSTVPESKLEEKKELVEQGKGQGLLAEVIGSGAAPVAPVKEPVQDTRIKSLFLDNLHLFFGDIHLKPIKEFINPSHQLNQHLDMSTMNGLDRENYEHGRLLTLLKTMFFRESKGVISKDRVFKGGGITIDQLKNKIKKGISLIVPKS
jgi:hypothetical protein